MWWKLALQGISNHMQENILIKLYFCLLVIGWWKPTDLYLIHTANGNSLAKWKLFCKVNSLFAFIKSTVVCPHLTMQSNRHQSLTTLNPVISHIWLDTPLSQHCICAQWHLWHAVYPLLSYARIDSWSGSERSALPQIKKCLKMHL